MGDSEMLTVVMIVAIVMILADAARYVLVAVLAKAEVERVAQQAKAEVSALALANAARTKADSAQLGATTAAALKLADALSDLKDILNSEVAKKAPLALLGAILLAVSLFLEYGITFNLGLWG